MSKIGDTIDVGFKEGTAKVSCRILDISCWGPHRLVQVEALEDMLDKAVKKGMIWYVCSAGVYE